MLAMLQDLVQHKWHANACLLKSIGQHQRAAEDEELRKLLHHILIANRFWFALSAGLPFAIEEEQKVPDILHGVVEQYRVTHSQESPWIAHLQESGLARPLETPYLPGQRLSVAEAIMQVCMHSHGHRAQCATRLRQLGGMPPVLDFIVWLKEHPAPDWS